MSFTIKHIVRRKIIRIHFNYKIYYFREIKLLENCIDNLLLELIKRKQFNIKIDLYRFIKIRIELNNKFTI